MTNYCRFCLKSPQGITFQQISTINGDQFKLILPEIDLSLTESPTICSDCAKSLQDAYDFKMVCLETDNKIKTFIEGNKSLEGLNLSEDSDCGEDVFVRSEHEDEAVKKLYKCEVCNKTFSRKYAFELHQGNHQDIEYICEICNKHYTNARYLRDHKNRVHKRDEVEHPCEACGKIFASQVHVKRHIYRVHTYNNKGKYSCDVCKRRFPKSTMLKNHKLLHSEELKYPCTSCDEKFSTKFYLRKHQNDQHYDTPEFMKYFCPVCDGQFESYGEVLQHRRESHLSEKNPHTCEICGIPCYTAINLKSHMRTHTGERPFPCDVCGKAFTQKGSLNVHKKSRHSSVKPFSCTQCERTFVLKSSLVKHLKMIHFSDRIEKKFKCTLCPKAYVIQSQLTYHMRWHTGERLYICSTCGKRFVSKTALRRHHLIHSDEKNNVCEICGKGFHQKGNLKIHMKVHKK